WHTPFLKLVQHLLELCLEQRAGSDGRALLRDPRADLALERTLDEIRDRLRGGDALGAAGDFELPGHFQPGEEHRRVRVLVELLRLFAGVVGEKDKAALV